MFDGSHINGNLYAYAGNNPVRFVDPDGNSVAIGIVGILLAASAVVMYYSLPIVHESQRQISDEIFYGAYNLRKTFTFSLSQKAESKSTAKQNPLIQQPVTATPGAPMPNNGDGNQHGNEEHDNSIERKLKEIKEQGATDIRKNQAQVDAKGNKVGKNRPDLQWNDANGKHHCWEVDHNPSNSVRHGNVILSNDPNAILELELLY